MNGKASCHRDIRGTNTQQYVAWPCPFFGATQVEHEWIKRPMTSEVRGRIWPPYIGTFPATVALGDLKAGFLLPLYLACGESVADEGKTSPGEILTIMS